jgi:hypothetical protein
VIGLSYSCLLYSRFGIHIVDYAELGDFLLAALRNRGALIGAVFLALYLVLSSLILPSPPGLLKYGFFRAAMVTTLGIAGVVYITYITAANTADSIKLGYGPNVTVQYRSSSVSGDPVTEPKLILIGATQKAVFFHDEKDNRTLVIPQAQIVSIEVPD